MGINITTIAYLRVLIIELGSTIILMVVEAQGIYTHQMLLIRDWTRIATPQKNCTNVKHWGRKFVKGGVGAILRLDLVKRQTDVFFETSRTILLNLSKSDASNLLRVSISYSAGSICENHWVNFKNQTCYSTTHHLVVFPYWTWEFSLYGQTRLVSSKQLTLTGW